MATYCEKDNINNGLKNAAMKGDLELVNTHLEKGAIMDFESTNNATTATAINNHKDALQLFGEREIFKSKGGV